MTQSEEARSECFSRRVGHNPDEIQLVKTSMEVWGGEARVLAGGVAVQAYPGKADRQHAYSFGTLVEPKPKFGFRGKQRVVREVFWTLDMEGVEERLGGDFAAIPIEWFEEWSSSKT
ncbi:hypothetical protein [Pseudooceanicola antarcticus]|uniref:hypothetical protein n=1 Tax=Pseudooceanicola antarcticus TaxID=1247613 RepID=UPI00117A721B|nr:hypothetical protein [Pseudooceanicola antarcticus]